MRQQATVVIQDYHFELLVQYLFARNDIESGALAFYNSSELGTAVKLLIKAVEIPTEADYLRRSATEVSFTPEFAEKCHCTCEQNQWSIMDIHTHPMSTRLEFSAIDDAEALDTKIPYLKQYVKGTRIAFLVFGSIPKLVQGRFWSGEEATLDPISRLLVI